MIGGNLHAIAGVRQDLAQTARGPRTRLAKRAACGKVAPVMVAQPLRAVTGSLNRYLFPDGRRAFPPSTPPVFSLTTVDFTGNQRSFAQTELNFVTASTGTIRVPVSLGKQSYTEEGSKLCRLPNGSLAPHVHLHSLRAGTPRLSRACLVRAQVPARLSFSTATLLQVPSSVARQTCFTASRTPVAADPVAGQRLRLRNLSKSSHRTLRSGGFLLSAAGLSASSSAGRRLCCQEKEGT